VFSEWVAISKKQAAASTNEKKVRDQLRVALGVAWPDKVSATKEGSGLTLSREGVGDHVPARWSESSAGAVLIVHEDGSAAAERSDAMKTLRQQGKSTLLVDVFQTGAAEEPRNFTFTKGRREEGYYLAFNRSEDANRVQDILTALAYARSKTDGPIQLVGLGKAAVWATFAAAVAPTDIGLCADAGGFEGRDEDFLKQLFVPGVQRAGGWDAALHLTERARNGGCKDAGL